MIVLTHPRGNIADVRGAQHRFPVVPEGKPVLEWRAFPQYVNGVAFPVVEEYLAGIEKIVLTKKMAFRPQGAFDERYYPSLVRRKPRDYLGGFGVRAYAQGDGFCFPDHFFTAVA